ncbi:hypothetical protein CBR_g24273 [Chara braunii]|uniref:Xylanase inhibitor C-terminal domain-containing protein n=1 Tax=Chara braunii TaxID=69332 RepID=A0A388JMI1_CHABU|nr:hypothetical protein CBR_g24273 [Chara braunii]|eukprot:GBG58922.1 hypothetical protein CBR_g24273 [Chara braunii]
MKKTSSRLLSSSLRADKQIASCELSWRPPSHHPRGRHVSRFGRVFACRRSPLPAVKAMSYAPCLAMGNVGEDERSKVSTAGRTAVAAAIAVVLLRCQMESTAGRMNAQLRAWTRKATRSAAEGLDTAAICDAVFQVCCAMGSGVLPRATPRWWMKRRTGGTWEDLCPADYATEDYVREKLRMSPRVFCEIAERNKMMTRTSSGSLRKTSAMNGTVHLEAIRVGSQRLSITEDVDLDGIGTIVDSGSTFTYLPTREYTFFVREVKNQVKLTQVEGPDPRYDDICFKGASRNASELERDFPEVYFEFGGNAALNLKPESYLFKVEEEKRGHSKCASRLRIGGNKGMTDRNFREAEFDRLWQDVENLLYDRVILMIYVALEFRGDSTKEELTCVLERFLGRCYSIGCLVIRGDLGNSPKLHAWLRIFGWKKYLVIPLVDGVNDLLTVESAMIKKFSPALNTQGKGKEVKWARREKGKRERGKRHSNSLGEGMIRFNDQASLIDLVKELGVSGGNQQISSSGGRVWIDRWKVVRGKIGETTIWVKGKETQIKLCKEVLEEGGSFEVGKIVILPSGIEHRKRVLKEVLDQPWRIRSLYKKGSRELLALFRTGSLFTEKRTRGRIKTIVARVIRNKYGSEVRRRPCVKIPFSPTVKIRAVMEVAAGLIVQGGMDPEIARFVDGRIRVVEKKRPAVGMVIHNQWECAEGEGVECTCRGFDLSRSEGHVKVRINEVKDVPGDLEGCCVDQRGIQTAAMTTNEVRRVFRKYADLVAVPIDRNPGATLLLCLVLYHQACTETFNGNPSFRVVHMSEGQILARMKEEYLRKGLNRIARWQTGGKVGQAYVLPKDKDLGRWRPISPSTSDPARLAAARVGRAIRFMLFGLRRAEHFDLKSLDEVGKWCKEVQGEMMAKGDGVLVRSYDIKDMFARLSHESVMEAVEWVVRYHEKKGMKGVKVSTRGKMCAMMRKVRSEDGFVILLFEDIKKEVEFELSQSFVRCAGTMLSQRFGILMGRNSSPALECLVCAMAESEFIRRTQGTGNAQVDNEDQGEELEEEEGEKDKDVEEELEEDEDFEEKDEAEEEEGEEGEEEDFEEDEDKADDIDGEHEENDHQHPGRKKKKGATWHGQKGGVGDNEDQREEELEEEEGEEGEKDKDVEEEREEDEDVEEKDEVEEEEGDEVEEEDSEEYEDKADDIDGEHEENDHQHPGKKKKKGATWHGEKGGVGVHDEDQGEEVNQDEEEEDEDVEEDEDEEDVEEEWEDEDVEEKDEAEEERGRGAKRRRREDEDEAYDIDGEHEENDDRDPEKEKKKARLVAKAELRGGRLYQVHDKDKEDEEDKEKEDDEEDKDEVDVEEDREEDEDVEEDEEKDVEEEQEEDKDVEEEGEDEEDDEEDVEEEEREEDEAHDQIEGAYCLSFMAHSDRGMLIGGSTMANILVVYDRANQRLGFRHQRCSRLLAEFSGRGEKEGEEESDPLSALSSLNEWHDSNPGAKSSGSDAESGAHANDMSMSYDEPLEADDGSFDLRYKKDLELSSPSSSHNPPSCMFADGLRSNGSSTGLTTKSCHSANRSSSGNRTVGNASSAAVHHPPVHAVFKKPGAGAKSMKMPIHEETPDGTASLAESQPLVPNSSSMRWRPGHTCRVCGKLSGFSRMAARICESLLLLVTPLLATRWVLL